MIAAERCFPMFWFSSSTIFFKLKEGFFIDPETGVPLAGSSGTQRCLLQEQRTPPDPTASSNT